MSDAAFSTAATPSAPEADKRVRYSLGQILGADEFEQEQFYFLERDRQHNRVLHGYGTALGLAVSLSGSEVRVEPGLALTVAGKVVRVDARQCANFAAWVGANAATLLPADDAGFQRAHVVLGYHECDTNRLPLPVTPCCGEGEGVATRIAETFSLAFVAEPPAQVEEWLTDRFGRLLRAIRLAPAPGTPLALADVPPLVRTLIAGEALGGPWQVAAADFDAVIALAERVWITEVRPQVPVDAGPPAAPTVLKPEEPVLLASLRFRLNAGVLDAATLTLDDSARPLLLNTRTLQERYALGQTAQPVAAAVVASETTFGIAPAVGVSEAYARADHTHGSPPMPVSGGDLTGPIDAAQVVALQGVGLVSTGAAAGQLLGFDGTVWRPVAPPAVGGDPVVLGGDANGAAGDNVVAGLQKRKVSGEAPAHGDALVWDAEAEAWRPRPVAAAASPVRVVAAGVLGFNGARGPVFGGLELVDNNPMLIRFDGYVRPNFDNGHMYILKAIAMGALDKPIPSVGCAGFVEKGILISLSFGAELTSLEAGWEVMLEVSEYGEKP